MTLSSLKNSLGLIAPGTALALVIAGCATFLSEHYTAPVMLYALLLGMAFNFLSAMERTRPGIEFSSKVLLRVGVALLGCRIAWGQVIALGWGPVVMIIAMVIIVMSISVWLAKLMGFNPLFGFLSGGATAICGASAALALSASLPPHEKKEQATLFTVIGVSIFSTLAMIIYPVIVRLTGLNDHQAGIFIGATIHDVAQVVGAGYAISPEAGDTGTIVKLLRVAMLLPVIVCAGFISRRQVSESQERPPLLPMFVVAFMVFVAINSIFAIPAVVTNAANSLSHWLLVTSIAAIGMKTRLGDIVKVGVKPVILLLIETVLLAAMVLAIIKLGLV